MGDISLIMKYDNLTDEECFELAKAIIDILKENNCKDYEVHFGKSDMIFSHTEQLF